MIVYFTGTGNSRYAAQLLAARLGDSLADAAPFIRDGIAAELFSDAPWVFVSPTYGWQLPRVFAGFLRSGSFEGSRDAWFVMTCGSEIGNTEPANRALCAACGLTYRGTLQVTMPENYIALFNAPGPAEAARIRAAARPVLEQAAADIAARRPFPARQATLADRLKSGPVHAAFYRFIVKAGPFRSTDACVGCGQCAAACPLGNIRLEAGRPAWGSRCTHCMACICGCPAQAIEYGKASLGKPRYQCPPYAGAEEDA